MNAKEQPPIQILETNMNFISKERPHALLWDAPQWRRIMHDDIGADGLELHVMYNPLAREPRRAVEDMVATEGLVRAFHQSWLPAGSKSLQRYILPSTGQSLTELFDLQYIDNQKRPLVAYPESIQALLEHWTIHNAIEEGAFAQVSAQMYPGLHPLITRGLMPFSTSLARQYFKDEGLKVCLSTFHWRRKLSFDTGKVTAMDSWEEVIPEMAMAGEIGEIHIELGRDDVVESSAELQLKSMCELEAFMASPEQAADTEAGQMVLAALQYLAMPAERAALPITIEAPQHAVQKVLGKTVLNIRKKHIIQAHQQIIASVRGLVDNCSA